MMKTLQSLAELTGEAWTGIRFHFEGAPDGDLATRPMRLCEAISESFTGTFVLPQELIHCPGAARSLGLDWSSPDGFAQAISEKGGMPLESARQVITRTSRLDVPPAALTIGRIDNPDVVVSYSRPDAAMRLARRWQEVHGTDIEVTVSSIMAVCGSVIAKAFKLGQPCLSFGCPDSREYGKIAEDKLILGMPGDLAKELLQESRHDANI